MRTARLLVLAGFVALAGAPGPARAGVVVRVAPEVLVDREDVRLADLGAIEGDEPLASYLRAISVGPAPAPGTIHRLEADALRHRLRQLRVDPAKVRLVVPERVVIRRAFQIVPGAALVEAVRRRAAAQLEADGESADALALVPVTPPADLQLPTGQVELDARVPEVARTGAFLAATVAVRVNGRDHQAVPLTFRVGRYRRVVVAARLLEPKTALRATDFQIERRPSTELPFDAIDEIPNATDVDLVRALKPGEIVTARALRRKALVRRGEAVTLVLEGRGFRITTQGRALEDAGRMEPVRVVNPTSKREILGRVEGPGVVRVPFSQPRSEP